MLRGEGLPNIEENVGGIEYAPFKDYETHVPRVKMEYKDDMPISLKTELRSYEIVAKVEKSSAKEFFAHKVERYADGTLKEIEFSNHEARDYFNRIYFAYRYDTLTQIRDELTAEIQMERFDAPGKYNSTTSELSADLEVDLSIRAAKQGKIPDTSPLGKINELYTQMKDEMADLVEEYKKDKPRDPKWTPPKIVSFKANDDLSNLGEEILEWVLELQEKDIPITRQQTNILTGRRPLEITRIIFGEVPSSSDGAFFVEERIAEKALFAREVLGFPVRKYYTVYEVTHLDNIKDTWVQPNRTNAEELLGARGAYKAGTIYLNRTATSVIDSVANVDSDSIRFNTHHEIPEVNVVEMVDHEAAHAVDVYVMDGTRPQAEGFADGVDAGFVFENIVQELRYYKRYSQDITYERLCSILSKSPPEGLVGAEVYTIPATFYSYIYEKLGPRNFTRFYGLLTGGLFETSQKGIARLDHKKEHIGEELFFEGNITHCLDALPKDHTWTWNSSREFIDQYLQEVNEKRDPLTGKRKTPQAN